MLDISNKNAYLVTKPEHIFYTTGFPGEGFVIRTRSMILLATDQRYWLLAKKLVPKKVRLFDLKGDWKKELQIILKDFDTVLFEEDHLTVGGLERWQSILPKKKWIAAHGLLRKKRLVKTKEELEKLRKAAQIGDLILKKILPKLKPGVQEKSIANMIRALAHELADGVSFDPIVAFGVNGAVPHHHSDMTKLKKDDAVLIDMGVKYQGYMSDMTRCFFVGKGLPKVREMYELLLKVQQAGVNMVRAGIKISDLDKAVRGMLGKEEKYFTHSLGHGVGLEIHEDPSVSSRNETVLQLGMVITIEPGLYKAGVGGVRIEDTVIVTDEGCEVMTKSSKKSQL